MSHGEVLRTHQSGLSGCGFWGSLWNGIKSTAKSIGGFLKDTWKPIVGTALDKIADLAGSETGGFSHEIRKGVRQFTGVGIAPPMTRRRIKGGSFRLG
ncbi:unnamed protein product [Phytophthora fragariaefolia]|uniref:Unnamed protein product n=1 Tax=Phytophthora fragariaefolia TaxID=1490495 RepID=A0A9W7D6I1_9STRA|nr:unnamed protein product [Phytophthora fragariaefolia]